MGNGRLYWPFVLFFGWLLAFPLSGPLLYQLAAARGFNGDEWALLFALFHALGFLLIGLVKFPDTFWRGAPFWSCLACLVGTIAAWFISLHYGAYLMAGMGFAASFFVVGCAICYTKSVASDRTRFMAAVILLANCFVFLVNLISGWAPLSLLFALASIFLIASLRLPMARNLEADAAPGNISTAVFPGKLLFLICLLIFGLDINGGFMNQIIFPSFSSYQEINRYYNLLPYMATLLIFLLTQWNRDKMILVYLGSAALGLGFVAYALVKPSIYQYFLIDSLILAGFAFLDIFIWVMLGDIAYRERGNNGWICRVFGLGLCANVLPLALGGMLGVRLKAEVDNYPVTVALLASATIFLTSILIPALVNRIKSDLLRQEVLQLGIEIASPQPAAASLANYLQPGMFLTPREEELLKLILDGCNNEDIANQLKISVNTVKVHVKNIIKKFGVANKNELLALILRTYKHSPDNYYSGG